MKSEVPKLNRAWHLAHKMPLKASFAERVQWHLEHRKHCACRPIPEKLMEEMKQKGITIE